MKYRIVEENCLFVPQYKKFLLWNNFPKIRDFMGLSYFSKEAFSSLGAARKFLDEKIAEKIAEKARKKKPKIYPH